MAVTGPGPVQGGFPIRPTQPTPAAQPAEATRPTSPTDEVQISTAGKMLDQLQQSGELRGERLAEIKAAIDADAYETPEKLELALQRMLLRLEAETDAPT